MEKTGFDKLREVGSKLKGDVEAKVESEQQELAEIKSQLAKVENNTSLVNLYRESAREGSENIVGNTPQLKIHTANKSTTNRLSDGGEPNDGWFFHAASGEQYQTVKAHILYISRGYKSINKDENGNLKQKHTQLVTGVLIDGNEYKPFMMYIAGMRLNKLWEFGKQIAILTHAKPFPIPLFAVTVNLSTEKEYFEYMEDGKKKKGMLWQVKYEVEHNEDGSPVLIEDEGKFVFLKSQVPMMREAMENVIKNSTLSVEPTDIQEAEEAFSDGTPIPPEPVENVSIPH